MPDDALVRIAGLAVFGFLGFVVWGLFAGIRHALEGDRALRMAAFDARDPVMTDPSVLQKAEERRAEIQGQQKDERRQLLLALIIVAVAVISYLLHEVPDEAPYLSMVFIALFLGRLCVRAFRRRR